MSIPGWVTLEEATAYLTSVMAKATTETLQDHWTSILEKKLVQAYWSIVNAFVTRGYTRAQIDAWDRGAEFQMDIGVFLAMQVLGAVLPNDSGKVSDLDRRPELQGDPSKGVEPVALTIDGIVKDPLGTHGQITTGPMDTGTDRFSLDPQDSRIGIATRF